MNLQQYIDLFQDKAGELPTTERRRLLTALETKSPRTIFLALDELREEGFIQDAWSSDVEDFFWLFCH